ncbi:MAG: SIMPL domain-containing protein [Gemmatimonadaceae bacterium]
MLRRLVLLAVLPLPLAAQVVSRDSVITVSASRTARVAPDRATLYVIIEGTAETPTAAVARADSKVKAVTEALRMPDARVEAERPIAYSVGPTQAPIGYPSTSAPTTHVARIVIRAGVGRPDRLASVIAAVLEAGASNTSPAVFESATTDSVRRARVGETLAAAKLDAESLAKSLGGHLGALVDVSTSGGGAFVAPSAFSFDGRFGQQALAPEVTITTTVTVRYRLLR